MSGKSLTFVVVFGLLGILAVKSLYIVNEFQRAVLLRLGKVHDPDITTGLRMMVPFFDEVRKFDGRVLTLDNSAERFLTVEKKSILVDSFAKWRIIDVSKYYTATNGENERAERLISQRINEGLRNQFAQRTLQEVVSGERDQLMVDLKADLNNYSHSSLGVEVVDVRVKRIDLPEEVSGPVYERMRAEREREAKELRAIGSEQAEITRAEADREVITIAADAYRQAELLRGKGDAVAADIYAKAFEKDAEFYNFVRSLEAYRKTFQGKDDVLLIDPESDFFKYLKSPSLGNP